jgi:hypothetical protein
MSLENNRRRCLVHVPDPFRSLDGRHSMPIALSDLLTDATIEDVRKTAYVVQNKWYLHGGRDFSQWNGFSLGKMVAGPALRNELHRALSNYGAYCRQLEQRPGTKDIDVRHDPGIVPKVWQHESTRRGINFRLVADEPNLVAAQPRRRYSLRERFGRVLTRVLSRLKSPSSIDRGARPLAMLVDGSLNRHTELCAALDSSQQIDTVRTREVLAARQRKRVGRRTSESARTHFAELWNSLQRELQRCDLLGEALGGGREHVLPILRETFLHRLPSVTGMIETARTTLESCRPTLLLAEAQPGNDNYVWSCVARSLGIPVVSITNEVWGLPMHAYGFPPTSDYVLLTSPLSRSWWIAKGFSEDDILPARCRYLDTPKRERHRRDRFTVLCTVTRYGPELLDVPVTHPRQFVQAILSVAQIRPHVQFVLKFHPGTPRLEGEASFASQIAFVKEHSPPNVEVAPLDSNMSTYLQRADCLLCSSSSFTIFEAFAHGLPCILAPPRSAILDQCPFFQAMQTHSRVTNLENITAEIDAMRNNPNEAPENWHEGVFYSEPAPSEVV